MDNPQSKTLFNYGLDAHGMKVDIKIIENTVDFTPQYMVNFPGLGNATKLLLLSLRGELSTLIQIDPSKIQDDRYVKALDARFKESSTMLIDKYIPGVDPQTKGTAYLLT